MSGTKRCNCIVGGKGGTCTYDVYTSPIECVSSFPLCSQCKHIDTNRQVLSMLTIVKLYQCSAMYEATENDSGDGIVK